MNTLFKILFRKTAQQIANEAIQAGIEKGFDLGREYERKQMRGVILSANTQKDIEEILLKAGF